MCFTATLSHVKLAVLHHKFSSSTCFHSHMHTKAARLISHRLSPAVRTNSTNTIRVCLAAITQRSIYLPVPPLIHTSFHPRGELNICLSIHLSSLLNLHASLSFSIFTIQSPTHPSVQPPFKDSPACTLDTRVKLQRRQKQLFKKKNSYFLVLQHSLTLLQSTSVPRYASTDAVKYKYSRLATKTSGREERFSDFYLNKV